RAGDSIVAAAIVARLKNAVIEAVGQHHRAQPMSDGIPREELREHVFARGRPAVFDVALADLEAAHRIVVRDRVALATHKLALTPSQGRSGVTREFAIRLLQYLDRERVTRRIGETRVVLCHLAVALAFFLVEIAVFVAAQLVLEAPDRAADPLAQAREPVRAED